MKLSKSSKGFTLIELLVVVAIIGILAATILASLGAARQKARLARAQSELSSMRAAQELYYSTYGKYDSTFNDPSSGLGNLNLSIKKFDTGAFGKTNSPTDSEWAYYINAGSAGVFCADSNGYSGKNTSNTTISQCTPSS